MAPPAKKRKSTAPNFAIDPKFTDESNASGWATALTDATPFPHVQLEGFVDVAENPLLLDQLEHELSDNMAWSRKENDLYALAQTGDLGDAANAKSSPTLRAFREFLATTVREFVSKTSALELDGAVDATGSCYGPSDNLLPHNDLIGTRAIAFVYYLTPEDFRPEDDGGALLLYESDDAGAPVRVAKRLEPKRNSLLLFRVSETSWHSVDEVLGRLGKLRLSINGWFHSNSLAHRDRSGKIPRQVEETRNAEIRDGQNIVERLNKAYRSQESRAEIRSRFEQNSEVSLDDFFEEAVRNSLLTSLAECSFRSVGPLHLRNLEVADHSEPVMSQLLTRQLTNFLATITGLELNGSKSVTASLERVSAGCYTVTTDADTEKRDEGFSLDAYIFLSTDTWTEVDEDESEGDAGGYICYYGREDEDEILRVTPAPNRLALVYREPGITRFLKYVSKALIKSPGAHYFLVRITFAGIPESEDEP